MSSNPHLANNMDKYDRFEAWLREHGAHFEMVREKKRKSSKCRGIQPPTVLP